MRWTGFILVFLGVAVTAARIGMYLQGGGSAIGAIAAAATAVILAFGIAQLTYRALERGYRRKPSLFQRATDLVLIAVSCLLLPWIVIHQGAPLFTPCVSGLVMGGGICFLVMASHPNR